LKIFTSKCSPSNDDVTIDPHIPRVKTVIHGCILHKSAKVFKWVSTWHLLQRPSCE